MSNLLYKFEFKTTVLILILLANLPLQAQLPPSEIEIKNYQGIFAAIAEQDIDQLKSYINNPVDLALRDNHGRTPLLLAAHLSDYTSARLLLEDDADSNALDIQAYDLITIAAVNNDVEMIQLGLEFGADPTAVTSPYEGTALIAAAHLGHVETVSTLINAGAPLDHVNNLGWTALIESIVLGDGGQSHTEVLILLVDAGADIHLSDRRDRTPLQLAEQHGFTQMVSILENAAK